jgi:small-conductance mechanosensitive channel
MWNNSVDFFLNIWVKWDDTNTPIVTKWKFLRLIYEALNDNNISIPFPQTDLHIKDSIPLEFKVIK